MTNQSTQGQAQLSWREGGLPISEQFDDPYFSLHNGLAETEHVFLAGNDLPARFAPDFHIAELGFGTGLNLMTSWRAWEQAGHKTPLYFTSFEAFPMAPNEMARALAAFPAIAPWAQRFLGAWDGETCDLNTLKFNMITGDARDTLPHWPLSADCWFLDGFSPAKNPELWEASLMQAVYDHTKTEGTAATYTAAGFVRRGLTDAGFKVSRITGFGHKRHMTIAHKSN